MVDRISGQSASNIHELGIGQLSQGQVLEPVKQTGADPSQTENATALGEKVNISEEARSLFEIDRKVQQFSVLAARSDEEFDSDKVRLFKDMLDSGRISQYLNQLGNNQLADDLLNSPMAANLF